MQHDELAQKVRATTNALTHIWGCDGRQNYALAHVLAAYFAFKPAALLEDIVALSLTVPDRHQSLGRMVFSNMEDLLTQPLRGASIIAGVGLSFSQYKRLIYYLGKDSHDPHNRPLRLSTSTFPHSHRICIDASRLSGRIQACRFPVFFLRLIQFARFGMQRSPRSLA